MPDRKIHHNFGLVTGAGFAAYRARSQEPLFFLCETVGGVLGGICGGRWPDRIEPATSFNHRKTAHSVTAGAAMVTIVMEGTHQWERWCRTKAMEYRQKRIQNSQNDLKQQGYFILEILWHMAAGFITGLLVGYISHLVLDARTRRSLPII